MKYLQAVEFPYTSHLLIICTGQRTATSEACEGLERLCLSVEV